MQKSLSARLQTRASVYLGSGRRKRRLCRTRTAVSNLASARVVRGWYDLLSVQYVTSHALKLCCLPGWTRTLEVCGPCFTPWSLKQSPRRIGAPPAQTPQAEKRVKALPDMVPPLPADLAFGGLESQHTTPWTARNGSKREQLEASSSEGR